jgi:hypothetical protein
LQSSKPWVQTPVPSKKEKEGIVSYPLAVLSVVNVSSEQAANANYWAPSQIYKTRTPGWGWEGKEALCVYQIVPVILMYAHFWEMYYRQSFPVFFFLRKFK